MRRQNFDCEHKMKSAEKIISQYENVIKIFNKKLKRLNVYEKTLEIEKSMEIDGKKVTKESIIDETKVELILCYLANIS